MGGLTPSRSHCTIKVPARCQYICYWNKRHPQAPDYVIIFSCNNKNISPYTYIIHVGKGYIFLLIQYKKNQLSQVLVEVSYISSIPFHCFYTNVLSRSIRMLYLYREESAKEDVHKTAQKLMVRIVYLCRN